MKVADRNNFREAIIKEIATHFLSEDTTLNKINGLSMGHKV